MFKDVSKTHIAVYMFLLGLVTMYFAMSILLAANYGRMTDHLDCSATTSYNSENYDE